METDLFSLHAALEERHWWFLGRRAIALSLAREILPAGSQVLDAGCGTGGTLGALAGTYACVGLDPSADAIRLARERFPAVRFQQAQDPAESNGLVASASLLLLMDVLEHLSDDFLFFSRLLQKIRPGGHLLITVPADPSLWSGHDVRFGHFRRYTRQRLEQLWTGLPVTVRLLSHYNSRLYPLVKGMRSLSRLMGKPMGDGGTDFSLPPAPVNRLLQSILAGESDTLVDCLNGRRTSGFKNGVSLIAVLRREEGTVPIRIRPPQLDDSRFRRPA